MSGNFQSKLSFGKLWEDNVKEWLESKGYSVERHTNYDEKGKEIRQFYIFIDKESYPHPDFTVTKNNDKNYVEVKAYSRAYNNLFGKVSINILNPNEDYLSIHKYHFDSYLQLARWKEIDTKIIFIDVGSDNWYSQNVEKLYKTKIEVSNAYAPDEFGDYYFWKINNLKRIR